MSRRRSRYVFTRHQETHRVRNFFLTLLIVVLAAALGLFAFNFAISRQVRLDRQQVVMTNLPEDLEQWSILHISDLHGLEYGAAQSGIARVIQGVNVSSIVLSGDMLGKDGDIQPLLDLVALLPKDKPKMMVLGDEDPPYLDPQAHGSLSPKTDWALALEEAGVTILDVPLLFTRGKKDQARIWFIPEELYSLDLDALEMVYQGQVDRLNAKESLTPDEAAQKRVAEYQLERARIIRAAKKAMLPTDVQIAVTHAPITQDYMNSLAGWGSKEDLFSIKQASLVLAGHYCGGQWRIPGLGPLYVPEYGWCPEDNLVQGLQYLNGVPQYISPGLGTSIIYPYMKGRLFNQPVLTYITLTTRLR